MSDNLAFAKECDAKDPLKSMRDEFHFPKTLKGEPFIYLVGNSLGLQPRKTREFVNQELDDWANPGVEGHFSAKHPWLPYHEFLADSTARLVGAKPSEVVVMNGTTVNLHLLFVSFYRPTSKRYKIVMEDGAFSSDRYAVQSQALFHGYEDAVVELKPRVGEATLRIEDIQATIEKLGDSLALVFLGGVNFYTGQAFKMDRVAKAGHKAGALVGFDLAHAAGNIELKLHDWDVDFALWCSYKYLNAGPGAIAGAFVHERHGKRADLPRFAGWWGHDKTERFQFGESFEVMEGAEGWQLSNPPILQLAALRASMEVFDRATMPNLRKKSVALTQYLESLLQNWSEGELLTPKSSSERGAQLSYRVQKNCSDLVDKLKAAGVLADFRAPDVLRVAPVPLYNSYEDVYRFGEILRTQCQKT